MKSEKGCWGSKRMLIVRKEAEEDIRAAYEWYEKQRENLGRAFLIEVDRTFEAMEDQPGAIFA
jgi:hypothetical protein